jgi:conjugative relaxase-like TrwC/TraI family protein
MISIKDLHGVDAWRYLMESVTDGQGDLREPAAVTRYFTDAGTPPGRWVGSGLAGLAAGAGLPTGSPVTGEQMELLFGRGRDPVSGEKLGRGFRAPRSYRERVAARVRALPGGLTNDERTERIEKIKTDERTRKMRHAVAGFDYTFNPAKSVSVLWALADRGVREQVTAAHHAAIHDVLALLERDVARTRVGTDGVAQLPVRGVVAAAFDHYDSREHDPQLHTHLVVANRVQTENGRWRTLDSRGLIFPSVVALSETYDNLLADQLTRMLGVDWEVHEGRKAKNAKWEIAGVPVALIDHFSRRRAQIDDVAEDLIDRYREHTGHEPADAVKLRLRQRATRATRRDKTLYPLAVLVAHWHERATAVLHPTSLSGVVAAVTGRVDGQRAHSADELTGECESQLVEEILVRLHETRATWSHWNIHAEAARASMKYRLATSADRDQLHRRLVAAVEARSVLLSAPPAASTPPMYRRPDGTSQFSAEFGAIYTSRTVIDAEARLLDAGRSVAGPRVDPDLARRVIAATIPGDGSLSRDQAAAVLALATSGRRLDLLVGAAGAGKTTAIAALRRAWEAEHGTRSVLGLAPTAKAARVLAGTLGMPTENTAKWLHETNRNLGRRDQLRRLADQASRSPFADRSTRGTRLGAAAKTLRRAVRRWELQPGQLVIVDEASMAGTLALDRLTAQASAVWAKVLLVGDWAQLSAVESGGAFRMLVADRHDAPELTTAQRFSHPWERIASVALRVGDPTAIDSYIDHDRVRGGDTDDMITAAYTAWARDETAGRVSLLIADTNATVAELNARARADRITWGLVAPHGHRLHDATRAGVGDRVVTRHNDRHLSTGPASWVKNGDTWVVRRTHDDGAMSVVRAGGGTAITLPAHYVARHVELAYAATAHRTQGDTVDTTHAVVRPQMSREVLYVAMTRGREANTAYVCTNADDDEYGAGEQWTSRAVLETVLARTGSELSAHETIRAEQERAGSIAQLAAEYDTIAREAHRQRWSALTGHTLDADARWDTSAAWPALVAGDNAGASSFGTQTMVAGLIPAATRITDPDLQQALTERAALIEQRAEALVSRAIASHEPWIAHLGPPPGDPAQRLLWERAASAVAAYRDRHGVTDPTNPIGQAHGGGQWTRRADRRRAVAIADARRASHIPTGDRQRTQPAPTTEQALDRRP